MAYDPEEYYKRMFDVERAKTQQDPEFDPYQQAERKPAISPASTLADPRPVTTQAPGEYFTGEPADAITKALEREFYKPQADTVKRMQDYADVMRRSDPKYMLDEAFTPEPTAIDRTGTLAKNIAVSLGQGVADFPRSAKASAQARDIEAIPADELLKTTLERKTVGEWWRNFADKEGREPTSLEINAKKQEIAELRRQTQIEHNQQIIDAFPDIEHRAFDGGIMMVVEDATTGLARSMPIMVSASVNPLIGFGVAAVQMHGQKASELIEEGYDPEVANRAAKLYAAPAALLETAGAVFGIRAFKTVLGSAGSKMGLPAIARKKLGAVMQNMIAEGSEEFLQEEWDVITRVYADHPEWTPGQILDEAKTIWQSPEQMKKAGYAALVGGVGGIIPGAGGFALGKAVQATKKVAGYKRPLKQITDEDYDLIQKGQMTQEEVQKKYKGRADIQGLIDRLYAEYTPPEQGAIPEPAPSQAEVAEFYGLDVNEIFDDVFLEDIGTPGETVSRAHEILTRLNKKEPTEDEVADLSEKLKRLTQPELTGIDSEIMESADIHLAAMKFKGKVFTGAYHGEAYEAMENHFGKIPDVHFVNGDIVEGFTTLADEFLDRDAAYDRAVETGQLKEDYHDVAERGYLVSEGIKKEPEVMEDIMWRGRKTPGAPLRRKAKRGAYYFAKDKRAAEEYGVPERYDVDLGKVWNVRDPKTLDPKIKKMMEKHSEFPLDREGPLRYGDWAVLEDPAIRKAMKAAGYDSYTTSELGDVYGVFDKKRIEAAPEIMEQAKTPREKGRKKRYPEKKEVTKETVAADKKKTLEIAKRFGVPTIMEQVDMDLVRRTPKSWVADYMENMFDNGDVNMIEFGKYVYPTWEDFFQGAKNGAHYWSEDMIPTGSVDFKIEQRIDKKREGILKVSPAGFKEQKAAFERQRSESTVMESTEDRAIAAIKERYGELPVVTEPVANQDKLIKGFNAIAKKGKKLMFFKATGPFSRIAGFHVGNNTFISDTADVAWHTYMHESFHDLRVDKPELFKSLVKLLRPMVDVDLFKSYKKVINDFRVKRGISKLSNIEMMEEYTAMYMGTAANTKTFWRRVFKHDYSLFDALGQKTMEILKVAGPHIQDERSPFMFKNHDAVLDVLAEGYREYWADAGLYAEPGESLNQVAAAQVGYAAESLSYSLDPSAIAAAVEGGKLKKDTIDVLNLLGQAGSIDDSLMAQLAIQKYTPRAVLSDKEMKLKKSKGKGRAKEFYEKALRAYNVTKKLSRKQVANQMSRDERPSYMNITLAMKNNKGLKAAVKKLGKAAGVELFEKDGSFKHHPMEERTKPDPDKVFKRLPLYGGFRRSIAQTMMDEMSQDRKESFRKDIVSFIEKAHKQGTHPKLFDRKLENIQDNEYRIASAVRTAHKTLGAINLNSVCPMFNVGNHGCYLDGCYVTGQGMGGQGMNFYTSALYTGEILEMSQEAIDKFNDVGGLRINGSGDTTNDQWGSLQDVFKHAGMRGLKLKWITKQETAFEFMHKMQASKDKNIKKTALATVLQPTIDPYWVPVTEDDMKGSAVDVLELRKAADAGKTDAVIAAYKQVTGREARLINGQVYRKYGFSSAQLVEISKKYKKVKIQPRLVVGTFKEIAEYALNTPEMIQTWMHAAIRPGMYSEIDGRVLNKSEIGNFRLRATFVQGPMGYELKGTNATGKVVEGAKVYDNFNKYVTQKYSPQQRIKIYDALFGMNKKDSSALCCRAGATEDACNTCTSHCQQGSSYTGTALRGIAERAEQLATFEDAEGLLEEAPKVDIPTSAPEIMEQIEPSAALKKWQKDSVVKEDLYHVTDAKEDFDIFDPDISDLGPHFGTIAQTEGVAEERRGRDEHLRVFPVRINLENPLRVIDTGSFSEGGIGWQLESHTDLQTREAQDIVKKMTDDIEAYEASLDLDEDGEVSVEEAEGSLSNINKIIRKAIQDLGYDGVIYLNRGEGFHQAEIQEAFGYDDINELTDEEFLAGIPDARDSYIIFEPNQVKSVWNKKPTGKPSIMEQVDAWHGTPYEFEKFKTEKIGTGEGAAAFGWGLYFTDKKEIGEYYAKSLADRPGKLIGSTSQVVNAVSRALNMRMMYTKDLLKTFGYDMSKESLAGALQGMKKVGHLEDISQWVDIPSKHLYSVTIHKGKEPGEYTWLDWYEDIDNQTIKKLSKSIRLMAPEDTEYYGRLLDIHGKAEANKYIPHLRERLDEVADELDQIIDTATGKNLYFRLADRLGKKGASLMLLKNGIDGIRYPAESLSGKKDSKDSNYVVFDEAVVDIEEVTVMEMPELETTPDIDKLLRDKIGVEKKSIKTRTVEAFDDFWKNKTTRTVDRMHPIKDKLGGEGTAYMLHRGLPGVQSTLNALMAHGKLELGGDNVITTSTTHQGFLQWIKDIGQDAEKAFYWIMAKRAETLDKEGREHWLTPEVRKIILDWVGDPKGNKPWAQINKEFQEWNQSVLDIAVKAGLLTNKQINEWQRDFYIPFYRVFEDAEAKSEYIKGPVRGKISLSARVMRLKGGEQKLGDPFENILKNWSHLINESMTNVARAEAYHHAKDNDIPSGMTAIDDDGNETPVPMIEDASWADTVIFRPAKGDKAVIFVEKNTGEEILSFMDKGKAKFFKVNDPELFQALSLVNKRYLDGHLMRALSGTKRVLTAGATFGPAFRIANMIRDTLHTYQITDKMTFKPFIDTAKGLVSAWRQDKDFVEFMASGHAFGGSYVRADDPKWMNKYIKKLAKQHNKSFGSIARNMLSTPKKMLEFWERVGSASENAARVQLYKNLRKEGKTNLEAAFSARDLMDFQMSGNGDVVGFLIATVPFLNARMQGLYRMGRAAVENPKVFFTKGAMIAAATLLLWWMNHDDERYISLEDWEKFSYYHFWIGDEHYRIPKPFETGAFFSTMFEASADVMAGNEDGEHLMEAVVHTIGETFAFNPIPQAVRPIAEQWANKSFFTGRPIESQYQQKLKPGERYDPWTSPTLVLAGKMGIPPKRAEALIRGYFADIGMSLLWGADLFTRAFADFPEKPTKRIDEYPMIGRFIRQAGPKRSTKYMTKFWETMKEVDELVTTINMYSKSGDFEGAKRLAEAAPKLIAFRPYMNKARQQLRKMSYETKRIWNDRNLTADQKKAELDKIYQIRNDLVKRIYDSYLKNL
jgi:hypothetical protein